MVVFLSVAGPPPQMLFGDSVVITLLITTGPPTSSSTWMTSLNSRWQQELFNESIILASVSLRVIPFSPAGLLSSPSTFLKFVNAGLPFSAVLMQHAHTICTNGN